jgi:hypothetical protein
LEGRAVVGEGGGEVGGGLDLPCGLGAWEHWEGSMGA